MNSMNGQMKKKDARGHSAPSPRLLIFVLLPMLLLFSGVSHGAETEGSRLRDHVQGDLLPPFTLPLLKDNRSQNVAPGKGKPSAYLFFSVTPEFRKQRSLALLSALNSLQADLKGKAEIVAIYSEESEKNLVLQFMKEGNISIPVYHDGNRDIYNLYGVFMMPLVVVLDGKGALHEVIPYTYNIRELVEGNLRLLLGEWNREKLLAFLEPKEVASYTKEEKEYIRHINYGRVMMARKMFGQAIREFTTSTKLQPKKSEAFTELGFAQLAAKDWPAAEKSFRQGLDLDPESDDAIAGIGLAIYGQGKADLALPHLENAFIAPKPKLEVIISLAEIYEKKGNMDKAIRLNKLAISRLMTMYEHQWQ
ncbi:MAG: hypothetical protein AB1568_01145 [Thermodesulfobacteriota bacterium]